MRDILETRVFGRGKRRLLVVTHRFTDPPLGGGEVHLLELLRRIDRCGDLAIDVATLDIVTIENQFHFSSRYTRNPAAAFPRDLSSLTLRRFPVDQAPESVRLAGARELFSRWMAEGRALSLRVLDRLPSPLLLGRWHFPERDGGRVERWSSLSGLVHVQGVDGLTLRGWAPAGRRVRVRADGETLAEHSVDGEFALSVGLAGQRTLEVSVDAGFEPPGDPRSLGVRIREMRCDTRTGAEALDLETDYRTWMKRQEPVRWIEELIATARARPREYDDLFQRTRGPASAALEAWLSESVGATTS
jgi:hypothetical protein